LSPNIYNPYVVGVGVGVGVAVIIALATFVVRRIASWRQRLIRQSRAAQHPLVWSKINTSRPHNYYDDSQF